MWKAISLQSIYLQHLLAVAAPSSTFSNVMIGWSTVGHCSKPVTVVPTWTLCIGVEKGYISSHKITDVPFSTARHVWKQRAKAKGRPFLLCWTPCTVWGWRGYVWSGHATDPEELGTDWYGSGDSSNVLLV